MFCLRWMILMARKGRKNAVELSGHQEEIEDLLSDENNSTRFISEYLLEEYGLKISYVALANHKKTRMNVIRDAAIDYSKKKSEKAKIIAEGKRCRTKHEEKVKKVSSDLEKLDEIIEDSFNTQIDLERLVNDPDCDQVKVEGLKLKKRQQGISAVNAKTNILKQDDTNVEVNIDNNLNSFVDESEVLRFIDESEAEESNSE